MGEDEYGYFKKGANLKATGVNAPREKRKNLYFPIYVSANDEVYIERKHDEDTEVLPLTDGKEMSWRWEKDKIAKENHNIMIIRGNSSLSIYKKQRPAFGDLPSKKPKSMFYKPEYSSGNGTNQIKKIFGTKIFNNPKPLDLIKDIIHIASDKNDIVLDSFAGSGTTGHAVLELNKEHVSDRKFILVEQENEIAEKVTSERLKRVIQGYSYKNNSGEDIKVGSLGGGFRFFELGDQLFDKHKQIVGNPSYESLAGYIYFAETRQPVDRIRIREEDWFIGEKGSIKYFLIHHGEGEGELNEDSLKVLKRYDGEKIVYAYKVMIDEEMLNEYKIVFKQVPYDVRTF